VEGVTDYVAAFMLSLSLIKLSMRAGGYDGRGSSEVYGPWQDRL